MYNDLKYNFPKIDKQTNTQLIKQNDQKKQNYTYSFKIELKSLKNKQTDFNKPKSIQKINK